MSPLALTKDNFSRCQVVLDSSIAGASAPLALHASSPDATIFLSGKDIVAYLTSLETADARLHVVDFAALKAEATATASGVGPATKSASAKKPEDAKIEGAVQIAIGVKKELDFPTWYTNVGPPLLISEQLVNWHAGLGQGGNDRLLQRLWVLYPQALVIQHLGTDPAVVRFQDQGA